MARATWALGLSCCLLSCGGDNPSSADGGRDAPQVLSENTAAMCQDGQDNDGDGFTDCADQDCWPLALCAEERPDGWTPPTDGGATPTDGFYDAPYQSDGSQPNEAGVDSSLQSCSIHYDCTQGEFCYKGKCLRDNRQAVFHCGKLGCPPGHWCLTQANKKERCPEDPNYVCQDACDCGPAHCCIDIPSLGGKRCVKDQVDPWVTQGGLIDPTVRCQQGTNATYCCEAPSCHAGFQSYGAAAARFRCESGQGPRTSCGGQACLGTACRCSAGESCVDVTIKAPVPGKSCGLFFGGSCISNALAEAVYGFAPADLLPCCKPNCSPGQLCDVGARSDGEYAYARIIGVCASGCPNGACEGAETPASCPEDCGPYCGDGKCFPEEMPGMPDACAADCTALPKCGVPGQERVTWDKLMVCGDGVCQGEAAVCDWNEPESCRTCPQDCGRCDWELVSGAIPSFAGGYDVWGSSGTDVFTVSGRAILHYDGSSWISIDIGDTRALQGVWGSSGTDVFAVGSGEWDPAAQIMKAAILHYDGTAWTPMAVGAAPQLIGVWGSSGSDVFAVGDAGTILHYDGTAWTAMSSGTTERFQGVWGSSASDVLAVGWNGTILHYDGTAWTVMNSGSSDDLWDVWGSSGSDIFVVGLSGSILHYNGTAWTPMASGSSVQLEGVWGSSGTNVFAVGSSMATSAQTGTILHYDGSIWKPANAGVPGKLDGVWGSSGSDVFVVGGGGTVLYFDGARWSLQSITMEAYPSALWAENETNIFAVGNQWSEGAYTGYILRFNGASWAPMGLFNGELHGVWGSSGSNVLAVGWQWGATTREGMAFRYDGLTWLSMNLPDATAALADVWGTSGTDVFAVGADGAILRYNGSSWTAMTSGTAFDLHSIWSSSGTDVFAVGSEWGWPPRSMILHYDGFSWSTMSSLDGIELRHVWGSTGTDVFAVGVGYVASPSGSGAQPTGGEILHYDGTAWTTMVSGAEQHFARLWGTSSSEVYALAGYEVGMLRYDGSSWSPARLDIRHPAEEYCGSLSTIGGTATGEGFIVGSSAMLLRHRATVPTAP